LTKTAFMATVTLLAASHVLTYDLLVLALPMVAIAVSVATTPGDRHHRLTLALLVLLYLARFSSVPAQWTHVQLSTLVMVAASSVLWRTTRRELTASTAQDAPPLAR
jgi:hypothetical protein